MAGIVSFAAYLPRLRLQRSSIVEANAWSNSALRAYAKGERSMCNWDEDSVTMAVEAARLSLTNIKRSELKALCIASTSLPFADRQNAGIVAGALNLPQEMVTLDLSMSLRAATSGMITTFGALTHDGLTLFVASEHRRTKAGSEQELLYGDGAGALVLGQRDTLVDFVDSCSVTTDFVDHFRGEGQSFDYMWEQRWIRDEGYLKIVPPVVERLLAKQGLSGRQINHFVMPCASAQVPRLIAQRVGISANAVSDTLHSDCGDTGTAHPIVMLLNCLESAVVGDRILLVGFGQGCDVLLFVVQRAVSGAARFGTKCALANRKIERNYNKFQSFNQLVARDCGKRSESDVKVALTALYRNRKMITGFVGGACQKCGTIQFPKAHYCVNPECGALDSQMDYPMADLEGRVVTWTADNLTYDPDPPAYYGMVRFDKGGQLLADFTDVEPDKLTVGSRVRMQFRIKQFDEKRGFRQYFWKAVPEGQSA
jgi:3-hydroxy-3-methylglutaryl CoA synthase